PQRSADRRYRRDRVQNLGNHIGDERQRHECERDNRRIDEVIAGVRGQCRVAWIQARAREEPIPRLPEDAEIPQGEDLERQDRENDRQDACRNRPETTPYGRRRERSTVVQTEASTPFRRGQG